MGFRKLAMVAALGTSLASTPVVAQNQAAPLSVAAASSTAAAMQSDRGRERGRAFRGAGTTTYIIAFFVIIVIAFGIFFAFDEDEGSISA